MTTRDATATPRPVHKRTSSTPTTRATTHPLIPGPRPDSIPSSPSSSSAHTTTPRPNKTASRIITSVRRSFNHSSSPKKCQLETTKSTGMYSTPEERYPYTPSRFRNNDPYATRPTIEQIAMGLHVSRTPHLRPVTNSYHSYSHPHRPSSPSHLLHPHNANPYEPSHHSTSPLTLPPPPARSSLKKSSATTPSTGTPGLSLASVSSTTMTSNPPSTPQSSGSLVSLKSRMSRFLPSSRSLPGSLSSRRSSVLSSPVSSPGASTADLQPATKKAVRFSATIVGEDVKSES